MEDFFKELFYCDSQNFKLNLSTLTVDSQVVSTVLLLKDQNRWRYWVPTFDSRLRLGSLGKVHLMKIVEAAFANGVSEVDLMIGEEGYKLKWSNNKVSCWQVDIFERRYDYFKEKIRYFVFRNARSIYHRPFVNKLVSSLRK